MKDAAMPRKVASPGLHVDGAEKVVSAHEFQLGRLTDVPAHPTEPWGDSMKRWNERYPTWRYGRPETFQYHAVQAWRVFLSKRPLDGDGDATQTVSGAGWRKGKKLKRPGDFSRTPA